MDGELYGAPEQLWHLSSARVACYFKTAHYLRPVAAAYPPAVYSPIDASAPRSAPREAA
jgi:hypothetical protein